MRLAGRGDRDAFETLVVAYQPVVSQYIRHYLGNAGSDVVDDLTQDVFLSAWRAAARFTPRGSVRGWLLRMATHICLNHRRWSRLRKMLSLDMAVHDPAPADTDTSTPQSHAIHQAVQRLSPRQRAVIVLRHYHDMSYEDMAEVMELSIPAIESLLSRGRVALRGLLGRSTQEISQDTADSRAGLLESRS